MCSLQVEMKIELDFFAISQPSRVLSSYLYVVYRFFTGHRRQQNKTTSFVIFLSSVVL